MNRISNFNNVKNRMTRFERAQYDAESLINLDSFTSKETDIIDCSSKLLFDLVQAEEVEFYYTGKDNSVAKAVQRSSVKAVKSVSFKESVIPIAFAKNVTKFLTYVAETRTYQFISPKENCYFIPERINL